MTAAGPPLSCPKCGATTIQATPVKRSSVDKALAAEYLRAAGSRESADGDTLVQQVCQRCGTRWLPRTAQERQLRALSGQLGPEAMKSAMADEAAKAAKAAPSRGSGRKWKVRPLTVVLAVIIVILVVLVILTTPQ